MHNDLISMGRDLEAECSIIPRAHYMVGGRNSNRDSETWGGVETRKILLGQVW